MPFVIAFPSWLKKPFFSSNPNVSEVTSNLPLIAKGTELRLTLENADPRQLYIVIFGTDVNCNLYALHTPIQSSTMEQVVELEEVAIASGGELVIPDVDNPWKWQVPESVGINTLYIILGIQPFTETLKAFAAQQNFELEQQRVFNVMEPIAVVKALMQDLHNSSSVATEFLPNEDVYALDVNSWATLKFVYEVTNS